MLQEGRRAKSLLMVGEYNEVTEHWYFNCVQHFWDSEDLDGQAAYVRKGPFQGKLQKGSIDDGKLRAFRRVDMERGMEADTLIVLHVLNHNRASNYYRMQPPPPRTGLFSAFMDEVEEVAIQVGCRRVWVEDVHNEFLPEKLERRGYQKVPDSNDPNPDYEKALPRG